MVVGRNNRVLRSTRFSNKRICGLWFGPQKSARNKGVEVLTGWSYGGVLLYIHLIRINVLYLASASD